MSKGGSITFTPDGSRTTYAVDETADEWSAKEGWHPMTEIALDTDDGRDDARIYRDPTQPATATPGAIPADLLAFARQSLQRWLAAQGGYGIQSAAGASALAARMLQATSAPTDRSPATTIRAPT